MILTRDELVEILTRHYSGTVNDSSPQEALAIDFGEGERRSVQTKTFHTSDGGMVVLDINTEGKVFSIEIV